MFQSHSCSIKIKLNRPVQAMILNQDILFSIATMDGTSIPINLLGFRKCIRLCGSTNRKRVATIPKKQPLINQIEPIKILQKLFQE